MNWFLAFVLCVPLVELVVRLPFASALRVLSTSGTKALHVVQSKAISDHWKEKVLCSYAQTTFVASAKLAAFLAVVLGVATLLVLGFERVFEGFQSFILGWAGIGASLVFASLYVALRRMIFHGRL